MTTVKYLPWHPAKWDPADAAAIQALADGNATEGQQKRALDFIINNLSGTYDATYFPTDRDTAFAEGKRCVGLQIVKLIKIRLSKINGID